MHAQNVDSLLIVFRSQLELQQSFQSDLLSTIYWALGSLIVVFALLIGFGWFSNFRIYQRDLDALRRELTAYLNNVVSVTSNELNESINKRFDESNKALEKGFSKRFENLSYEVSRMNCEQIAMDYKDLMAANSFGAAATCALSLLRSAVEINNEYYINMALTAVIDSIAKGGKLTTRELKDITELLLQVPDPYVVLRERARKAVSEANTM